MTLWKIGHRNIRTDYDPKPIPMRQFDWQAICDDTYDGADDSPRRYQIGSGRTEFDAITDLLEQLDMELPVQVLTDAKRIREQASALLGRIEAHILSGYPSPVMDHLDALHEALAAFQKATKDLEI